jgi:NAD+ diphosphatase
MPGQFARRTNFYSGAALDRADERRADPTWIEARLGDPRTRFLPVWRSRHFVAERNRPVWLSAAEAADLMAGEHHVVFLGLDADIALMTIDISPLEAPDSHDVLAGRGNFRDLREFGPLLPQSLGAVLAYARGLLHWHRRHLYCGICGDATESTQGGHVRTCVNPDCGVSHFPRTDPAVIMLIHDGQDHCVLGRQAIWAPGMHSTLAGFVEPGESLEEAVAREIEEEVGLRLAVDDIFYHSSQPWPFPSSLMLGFHAYCPMTELIHRAAPDRGLAQRVNKGTVNK